MTKKIILFTSIILLSTQFVLADEGYVSPESYAVNEADMMYISIPTKPSKPEKVRKAKHYKGETIYESKLMYNTKEFLQKQHKKMGNPHRGELHEIKLDVKNKNNGK